MNVHTTTTPSSAPAPLLLTHAVLPPQLGSASRGDTAGQVSIAIADRRILAIGTTAEAKVALAEHANRADTNATYRVIDLTGSTVVPGFIEAHSHLVNLGRSLDQVDLLSASSLAEMQQRIAAAAAADPGAKRILGRSWLLAPLAGVAPDRALIDAVVPNRPVYLVSNDLHSGWVNSAALAELGITDDTPDPAGGTIVRDAAGGATGLLLETAALVTMRGGIERLEDDAVRDRAVRRALESYRAVGVTAVADLGLRAAELAALERAWEAGDLVLPVAGYLRVETSRDPQRITEQLTAAIATRDRIAARALELRDPDPRLRISGVKLWIDGVVDSGTAAMHSPFASGAHPPALWRAEELARVAQVVDAAGMQLAMHAIGDAAVALALDAVAAARASNGDSGVLHRIEHVEVMDAASAARFAPLGVIASVQPVHADPLVQGAWRQQLGDARVENGYPWAQLVAAGARIALGTDAPTAPYAPLPNLFTALTRESVSHTDLPANHPELALQRERALRAATCDAAHACGWSEGRGTLGVGGPADLVVLDVDPFTCDPEWFRTARPRLTIAGGVVIS